MKKYLLVLSLCTLLAVLAGCQKDNSINFIGNGVTGTSSSQAATDDALIQAAIKASNITATKDSSGLYYQIVKPGTGAYPNVNSAISGSYTGKLLDGTVFDSGTLKDFVLSSAIKGWQIGVPHINKGGQIVLFVPSALGYGNVAQNKIPANSVLVFSINLVSFK